MLRITAIIPTFNEEDIIYHTIKHLVGQDISVCILDNESTDNTVEIARRIPNVQVRTVSSDGLFNEKILQDSIREVTALVDTDWIIKNDADEFIESPWKGVSLRQGIELVDKAGKCCIGVVSYVFYPMSDEVPHEPGKDVRDYYDHYKVWDKVDRWAPDIHPRHDELWKINIFQNRRDVYMQDPHVLYVPDDLPLALFPELFILRHYMYRNSQRTYQRLIKDRRDRLSAYNLESGISNHYTRYTDDSEFVRTNFTFDRIRQDCLRWSEL